MSKKLLQQIAAGIAAVITLTVAGAWVLGEFEGLDTAGTVALILGIAVALALGMGLMAAVFISNRGYDDAVQGATRDQPKHEA